MCHEQLYYSGFRHYSGMPGKATYKEKEIYSAPSFGGSMVRHMHFLNSGVPLWTADGRSICWGKQLHLELGSRESGWGQP